MPIIAKPKSKCFIRQEQLISIFNVHTLTEATFDVFRRKGNRAVFHLNNSIHQFVVIKSQNLPPHSHHFVKQVNSIIQFINTAQIYSWQLMFIIATKTMEIRTEIREWSNKITDCRSSCFSAHLHRRREIVQKGEILGCQLNGTKMNFFLREKCYEWRRCHVL